MSRAASSGGTSTECSAFRDREHGGAAYMSAVSRNLGTGVVRSAAPSQGAAVGQYRARLATKARTAPVLSFRIRCDPWQRSS